MKLATRSRITLKLLWLLGLMFALVALWNPAERFVYEAF